MNDVMLLGLDFGTTTSSAVAAMARLVHNAVTGRMELSELRECFRSPMTFTPIAGDRIDERQVERMLDGWLTECRIAKLFGGGALLTGLTAQAENAATLVQLIRSRIGDAVVARADDPRLESWLAFQGNCASLSRKNANTIFFNLDIGGGTTNLALGRNGEVLATGCHFIGARHVQVTPGSYRIVKLSPYARSLFAHLDIAKGEDDELTLDEVDSILDCYLQWLVAAENGDVRTFEEPTARLHQQIAMQTPIDRNVPRAITLSGGVGELVYAAVQGHSWPGTTAFGDLGIDLAKRLLNHSPWAADYRQFTPAGGGRSTSFGLLRHSTQVSGSTLYLSDSTILPLRDLPILGTIDASLPQLQWQAILELLKSSAIGGCIQILLPDASADRVRTLGTALAKSLRGLPAGRPLVVLVPGNVGKALGAYITEWDRQPRALVVIDEVPASDARFLHVGRLHDRVVPVSFYGLQA